MDFYLFADVDLGGKEPHELKLYWSNATHNLSPMWHKAGIYDALYDSKDKEAGTIIPALRTGLKEMIIHRKEYEKLNPPNGWGDYNGALEFLAGVLDACENTPKARIWISK